MERGNRDITTALASATAGSAALRHPQSSGMERMEHAEASFSHQTGRPQSAHGNSGGLLKLDLDGRVASGPLAHEGTHARASHPSSLVNFSGSAPAVSLPSSALEDAWTLWAQLQANGADDATLLRFAQATGLLTLDVNGDPVVASTMLLPTSSAPDLYGTGRDTLHGGTHPDHTATLAAAYLHAVQGVNPDGPSSLGSLGGGGGGFGGGLATGTSAAAAFAALTGAASLLGGGGGGLLGGQYGGMGGAPGSPSSGGLIPGGPSKQHALYKTEMCRGWLASGTCRYGSKCQFAHGREELRPVPRHPRWRTEPCRAFALTGTCSYGARCRFIHASSAPMALFGPPPGSSAAAIASLGMAGMMEGVGGWDEPLPPMLRSNTSATVLQHPNSNVGAAGMSLQMDTAPTPSHSAPQAFFNSRAAQVPPPGVDGGFSVVRHPHLTPGQQQAERLRRLFDRQDSGFAGGVSGMPVLSTVTEGVPSFMTAQQGGPWVRQQAALAAAAASNDVAGGARGSHDSSSASQYAPDMLELFASRGSLESLGARHASGVQGLFDLGSAGVVGPGLSHGFGSQSGHMAAAAGQSGAGAGLSYGPDGPYSAPLCKMRLQGDPMAPSLPFSAELWDNANLALLKIGSGSGNGSSWYTMQDAGAGANGRAASPAAPVHLHPASPRVGEGAQRLQAAAAAQAAQAAAQSQGAAAARSQAQAAAALQHQQHQAQQQQQQLGGAGPKGGRGGAAGGGSGSGSNPSGWGRLLNAIGGINRGAPRHS